MPNQIVINVDLGKGERGQRRKAALLDIAAEFECHWGGKPSIGRLICKLADAEIEDQELRKQKEPDDEETS